MARAMGFASVLYIVDASFIHDGQGVAVKVLNDWPTGKDTHAE